jgi:serine/threonine-protein kinase
MGTLERLQAALAGRYRVEREIGRGGMAVVYLALDEKHKRPVAIKVLRPDLAAAASSERFQREIEIAARLNHPNVLSLHDSGEADGLMYFVMPLIEGESLRQRIDRVGPLSLEDATRIVREVGSALSYAHELGLVHRDIKPENILFQAGHALVCDFGIAKAASEAQERLTQTGLAVGTFLYMSPEQVSDDGSPDARTDVYALGCLLHEMLSGDAPFRASTPQAAFAKKLIGDVPSLTALRDDVPPTVDDVVTRALATAVDDRFPSAAALVAALDYATTELAVERDRSRKRRGRASRAAASVVGVGGLGVAGWWVTSLLGAAAIERVAVLPVLQPGAQDEAAFFVQGVYQDLALELAKAGVRVKSPTSVARYATSAASVREISDSLDVDGLIQVRASQARGRVDVNVSLVDGTTEDILWIEDFTGEERAILGLYGDITRAVARELGIRLPGDVLSRLAAAPEVDPAVFEALQRARFHWQTLTAEGLATSLDYYELALERDSTSAEAWNGRAQVWLLRAQQGLVSAEEATREAGPALERAAQLDPTLPEIQASIALRRTWGEWSWQAAEEAFLLALEQDPFDAATRAYYALLLQYLGRMEESAEQEALAGEADPLDPLVAGLRAQSLNNRRRYDEAEAVLQAALARDRGVPFLLSTLRTTYHLMGREQEALANWRASFSSGGSYTSEGDAEALEALDRGHAANGYRGALRAVAELYVERSRTEHVTPWRIATLYTRAGMKEEALTYLELAYAARDQNCPYLSVEPTFDLLRDEPRFHAIIDGMGLPR